MIKFGDTIVKRVEHAKYSSMMLDPQLTFNAHVDYVSKKALGKIKLLGRLKYVLGQQVSASLYTTLILPIFDYNDNTYNCINQHDTLILQRQQNLSLKNIRCIDKLTFTELLHTELGFDMLHIRREKHVAINTYTFDHELVPKPVSDLFDKLDKRPETYNN